MTAAPPPQLPPLFNLFQQTDPGLLYYLASKPNLIRGATWCNRDIVATATWQTTDKSVLLLACEDGARVTFSAGEQLVPHCDCGYWTLNSQCPHVVATWIQLKRLFSPNSFPQINIDERRLRALAGALGLPRPSFLAAPEKGREQAPNRPGGKMGTRPTGASTERQPVRFVLEERFGALHGSFRQGRHEISRLARDAPRDVLSLMRQFPVFEPTIHHLTRIAQATRGRYPIVFRDASGHETVLTIKPDDPRRACLTLELDRDRLTVSRTVNGAMALSGGAMAAHELLVDPDDGAIYPLTNRATWSIWDNIRTSLTEQDREGEHGWETGFADEDDWQRDERDTTDGSGEEASLTLLRHRTITTIDRFNRLNLRLNAGQIPGFNEAVLFFHGSREIDGSRHIPASYLLRLTTLSGGEQIRLTPLVRFDNGEYRFSSDLFRYFDADYRARFSPALKARKRVSALVEACFELADAATLSTQKSVIKATLGGPDYLKRNVKNDARQILNTFAGELAKKPLMIQATPAGWRLAEDDRAAQTRLMKILYGHLGSRLFEHWTWPGEMTLERDETLPLLSRLAEELRQAGFGLEMDGAPLSAATWDFTLDATTSALDWFELKPEIRCDGELIGGEELRQLAGGGILQRNGRLILIDDTSARILTMLTGILAPPKRRKKGVQQLARIPRLQILDWLQMRAHGVTVRLAPRDAEVLESLLNFESIPRRTLPPKLNATLRPYQRDGFQWLAFLYEHRFGACLADDMGLGKTVQSISLLAGIADGVVINATPDHTPHLIVVPPSLLFNWENEISRFFPTASVLTFSGQGRSLEDFSRYDIILTSYGIIQRDIDKLADCRFNVIIFDEAQLVKNLRAATTSAARRLTGAFKLALTGTPVENRIEEYYAIMDLCLPGLLGNPEQLKSAVAMRDRGAGMDMLLRRTRPFVLRRNKQLISADLPEKIETDIHLELSPKQRTLYQRTIEEVRGQVRDAFTNNAPGQARIIALTALLRLRQICLAPSLALEGAPESSPKLDFLMEQLAELRDEGHSVLVFSQFTAYLDIVENGLKRHHFPCLRLDGSTPTRQRRSLVHTFQGSDEPLVFLISLKAGGKGLNLTRATYVYHLDPWWNPAVENQASDRAHRIGQTRQVTITRLVMRHTIEEKMMLLKEQKQKLYRAILEEGGEGRGSSLSREDFEFLLG